MPITFVSSLNSGAIAAVLEIFAIFLGLLIASNLQSIVSLTARRRLYSQGTARLCDTTWNIGVVKGFTNPRRLLRDYRALFAFCLAIFVISLEVLTVLQAEASTSCTFGASSTWKIEKSSQECFHRTLEAENLISRPYLTPPFISAAKIKIAEVDLTQGVPVHTNVFETSIVSGEAVEQLRRGRHAEVYSAPVLESTVATGVAHTVTGLPFELEDNSGQDAFVYKICDTGPVDGEVSDIIPMNDEYLSVKTNRSISISLSALTGFIEVQPCINLVIVRVCEYAGGRKEVKNMEFGVERDVEIYDVECQIHKISREGRRTGAVSISSSLYEDRNSTIDTAMIRRAILTSIVAQNSATTIPCNRHIAAPKLCTQVGWVSAAAVIILVVLFVCTSILRLGLKLITRGGTDLNGSPERLAEAMFDHFEGTQGRSRVLSGKRKKRDMLLGPMLGENEIHMSVLKGVDDPDSYRLAWTRGPIANPAQHIPSTEIVPHTETSDDNVEVSLV